MPFSDSAGSTLLLGRLGDRYVEALDAQRTLLRTAWQQSSGHEMGTERLIRSPLQRCRLVPT